MLLSAIYEMGFYDFSYGFREKRGPHDTIKAVRQKCYQAKVNTIKDADVSKFFNRIPHACIRDILRRRINDGKILQLIGKWLKAGVVENHGIVYPVIANIFLHHVLDEWFTCQAQPKLTRRSFIVRFADVLSLAAKARRVPKS